MCAVQQPKRQLVAAALLPNSHYCYTQASFFLKVCVTVSSTTLCENGMMNNYQGPNQALGYHQGPGTPHQAAMDQQFQQYDGSQGYNSIFYNNYEGYGEQSQLAYNPLNQMMNQVGSMEPVPQGPTFQGYNGQPGSMAQGHPSHLGFKQSQVVLEQRPVQQQPLLQVQEQSQQMTSFPDIDDLFEVKPQVGETGDELNQIVDQVLQDILLTDHLQDIGDCLNELNAASGSTSSSTANLETVSELCSNCGSFVTVQIDTNSSEKVHFKCTTCSETIAYNVDRKSEVKVEPQLQMPESQAQEVSHQLIQKPGAAAALRNFRKPKLEPEKAIPQQQDKACQKPNSFPKPGGGKPMSFIKMHQGGKPRGLMQQKSQEIEEMTKQICAVAPSATHRYSDGAHGSIAEQVHSVNHAEDPKAVNKAQNVGVVKPRVVVKIKLSEKAISKLDKWGEGPSNVDDLKKPKLCTCEPQSSSKKCKTCRKKAKKKRKAQDSPKPFETKLQIIPIKPSPPPSSTITSKDLEDEDEIVVLEEKSKDLVSPLRLIRKRPHEGTESKQEGASSSGGDIKKCLVKLTRIDKSKQDKRKQDISRPVSVIPLLTKKDPQRIPGQTKSKPSGKVQPDRLKVDSKKVSSPDRLKLEKKLKSDAMIKRPPGQTLDKTSSSSRMFNTSFKRQPMVSIPKSGLSTLMKNDMKRPSSSKPIQKPQTKSPPGGVKNSFKKPSFTMPSFSKLQSGFTIPKQSSASSKNQPKKDESQVQNPMVKQQNSYQTTPAATTSKVLSTPARTTTTTPSTKPVPSSTQHASMTKPLKRPTNSSPVPKASSPSMTKSPLQKPSTAPRPASGAFKPSRVSGASQSASSVKPLSPASLVKAATMERPHQQEPAGKNNGTMVKNPFFQQNIKPLMSLALTPPPSMMDGPKPQ